MSFWFYIAAAEFVIIAVFLQSAIGEEWPQGKWEARCAYAALFLWPFVFAYLIGSILWRVSRKLAYRLRSGKR